MSARSSARRQTGARQQRGAALLLLLLVVLLAGTSVVVSRAGDLSARQNRIATTHTTLASAKRALLSFALTYQDRFPGQPLQLPCPDLDSSGGWLDGESHSTACGATGTTVIGRFPWRTVGGDLPRDSSAACLWYVVSGTYKSAGGATSSLINPDSNGQIQVIAAATGLLALGDQPEDRAVAALVAPLEPLSGQNRGGAGSATGCSTDFNNADFLDSVAALGVSNAQVSGTSYAVEQLVVNDVPDTELNDRIVTVTRDEIEDAVYRRADLLPAMEVLARGLASCVAAYGLSNPGGATDRRLPWPAPMALTDYEQDANYADADAGIYSGRFPSSVDDSSGVTGNTTLGLLTDCNPALAPDWDPSLLPVWRHWKDHFFYTVAASFQPNASVPSTCGDCVTVNGGGSYAAVVVFGGRRLATLAQRRNAPPTDADTKQAISNYLEGSNATSHPYAGGSANYSSGAATNTFNDIVYCVDSAMSVSSC